LHGTVAAVDDDGVKVHLPAGPPAHRIPHGTPVWMTARGPDEGTLTAYRGVAAPPGDLRGEIRLTDLVLLVDEPRRTALRVTAERPILLIRPGRSSRATTTIDLSSTGCRVAMRPEQPLARGETLLVAVVVDHGGAVWADGQVVRVDEAQHEAALRFTRVEPSDAERLDRRVLSVLSSSTEADR